MTLREQIEQLRREAAVIAAPLVDIARWVAERPLLVYALCIIVSVYVTTALWWSR